MYTYKYTYMCPPSIKSQIKKNDYDSVTCIHPQGIEEFIYVYIYICVYVYI
jgi:hypothetical protein